MFKYVALFLGFAAVVVIVIVLGEYLIKKICFPADAVVQLESGTTKTMEALEIGDRVLIAPGKYSDVYAFSHSDKETLATFRRIRSGKFYIDLSDGHKLYVNGKHAAAVTASVGDTITLSTGKDVVITDIEYIAKRGLYCPHTLQGDIVVNGIIATTYTDLARESIEDILLSPMRAHYKIKKLYSKPSRTCSSLLSRVPVVSI